MADITINDALNDFQKLNDVDKEYFLEIAQKQLIELKRKDINGRVSEIEENFRAGKIKSGGSEELLKDLNND
ncbi:MAG: hypothetical protein M1495_16515 [Bacteroidetes bacterium]|nr:hypothetical protein [Bacteroidota bacterium]